MLQQLRQSEFVKQVLTLFTGSAIAQMLPFAAEPFITRLYTAEELGIITLYTSVAMVFSIVATGRYEVAIMLPESDKKSINLVALSLVITLLVTFLSAVAVWSLNDWICGIQKSDILGQFLWLVPFSVLAVGIFNVFNQWANRKGHHKWMSISRVTQSGSTASLNVLFGFLKMGNFGLVFAYVFGQFLSLFPVLFSFFKFDKQALALVEKKEMKVVAKTYRKFPTINSLHAFVDMFFLNAIVFLLAYYYGTDTTGFYGRTYKILLVPAMFIGTVVSQVFFRKISQMKTNNEVVWTFGLKIVGSLFLIGVPIFLSVILYGPEIFSFVLGEKFAVAGRYAAILAPWVWIKFIIGPLTFFPVVFNKLQSSFIFGSICNLVLVSVIFFGGERGIDIETTFKYMVLFQLILLPLYGLWCLSLSTKSGANNLLTNKEQ